VRRIEFAELPKTISGKIRRVELRRAEAANRQEGRRAKLEFWEDDFSEAELSGEVGARAEKV
jgi:acetyl-CoA synthetase